MATKHKRRSWPFIERISPRAAALLRDADALRVKEIDFADVFANDVSGDVSVSSHTERGARVAREE